MYTSINFFDFPDNLLLEDGQDSIIFTYLFKHHPAVKLVAYLLEIIPEKGRNKVKVKNYNLYLYCAQQATLRISKCYNDRNQRDGFEGYFKVLRKN